MKLLDKLLLCLFFGLIPSLAPTGVLAAPTGIPSVILDTDIGSDCDDAGALAVLHALADAGELEILGVVFSSGKNRYGVGTCDAINTYYGRGDLPLGQYQGTDVGDPGNSYTMQIAENTSRFGHDIVNQAPGLVETYKVKGRIMMDRDPNSNEGKISLEGIRITAVGEDGETYSVLTNSYGNYVLNLPKAATYEVSIYNVFGEQFILEQGRYKVQFATNKTVNLDFRFTEKRRQTEFGDDEQYFDFNIRRQEGN